MANPASVIGSVSSRTQVRVYGSHPLVWSSLLLPTQSGPPSSSLRTLMYTAGHHSGSVSALLSTSFTSAMVPGTRHTVTKWYWLLAMPHGR